MRPLALLLLGSPLALHAQDSRLEAIRNLLVPMQTTKWEAIGTRGPTLTELRHQLRDWIEARLPVLEWNGFRWTPNPVVLQEQLNAALRGAKLFCGEPSEAPCPDQSELGFLGPIVLDMQQSVLVVRTGVGIPQMRI